MSTTGGANGRGRGSKINKWICLLNFELMILERVDRHNIGPSEPYRSQSMVMKPEKFHSENKENGGTNHPLASSNRSSSGRKRSTEQHKSTSRSSTVRAKSTRPLRDAIRSAVPDSSIISMAKRPDRGGTGNLKTFWNFLDQKFFVFKRDVPYAY